MLTYWYFYATIQQILRLLIAYYKVSSQKILIKFQEIVDLSDPKRIVDKCD